MRFAKTQVRAVAERFTRLLHAEIGRDKFAEVIERNRKEQDSGVCHSHDFCDANEVMDAAISAGPVPPDLDRYAALWNAAWDYAKEAWQAETIYVTLEVCGVRKDEDAYVTCPDAVATFFTVYGRLPDGRAFALSDRGSREAAETEAVRLARYHGCPIVEGVIHPPEEPAPLRSQAILDRESANAVRCGWCGAVAVMGSHALIATAAGKRDCPNVGRERCDWTVPPAEEGSEFDSRFAKLTGRND